MSYAKLIDGVIEFAPINKGSIMNYNLAIPLLTKDGYKPFIEVDKPKNDRLFKITYCENETNISENIEYLETESQYQKRKENEEIQLQISSLETDIQNLDLKRIRSICEPETKDETTGETWLDYYNSQIQAKREEIRDLKERMN